MLQETVEVLMRGKDPKYFEDNSFISLNMKKEAKQMMKYFNNKMTPTILKIFLEDITTIY